MLNPLDLVKPYLTYALLAFAAAGWATAGVKAFQVRGLKLEKAEAEVKAVEAARAKESEWSLLYKETSDVKEAALRNIAAERDAALASLRNRPRERLPEAALAACTGTSGRELSGRDAEAFTGLAARADIIRAALAACQSRESVGR